MGWELLQRHLAAVCVYPDQNKELTIWKRHKRWGWRCWDNWSNGTDPWRGSLQLEVLQIKTLFDMEKLKKPGRTSKRRRYRQTWEVKSARQQVHFSITQARRNIFKENKKILPKPFSILIQNQNHRWFPQTSTISQSMCNTFLLSLCLSPGNYFFCYYNIHEKNWCL